MLTELSVAMATDQPLVAVLPLLLTVKLATKPPPHSLRLTSQSSPLLFPPLLEELELDDELLELLEDELELLELDELLDELELELELLEEEPVPLQFAADGLSPLISKLSILASPRLVLACKLTR